MELKQFGIVGLGVMGRNLAMNLLEKGVNVSVFNRHVADKEVDIAKNFSLGYGNSEGHDDLQKFVSSLERPRKIFLMINAGKAVDDVIQLLLPYLEPADIIMDGGNSYYLDTQRRFYELKEVGIHFLGIGVSGGEEGARKGPSLMPGGSLQAYTLVAPYLNIMAARDKRDLPCCTYSGPEGAGHFLKMVHNGLEYAEMQILAETYYLMKNLLGFTPLQMADTLEQWEKEGHGSFLLEITYNILRKKDGEGFLLDKILDSAEQKGTGTWTIKAAMELKSPVSTISEAVSARMISAIKKDRKRAAEIFGNLADGVQVIPPTANDLKNAYLAARIINHIVGFKVLQEASSKYKWDYNYSEIARIWTNGCIIRSELMEKISEYYKTFGELLEHPEIVTQLKTLWTPLSTVVSKGLQKGMALPVLSASLNYFLSIITANSPANLIQAQRDFFGAHTYRRVDGREDEYFHTNWTL